MDSEYQNAAQVALDIQSACNLSGILASLDNVRNVLLTRKRVLNKGTDWFNKHPIMYLFSVQIGYLTGACTIADGDFRKNSEACEALARGEEVEGL